MFLITAKNVEWLKNWFWAFESFTVSAWNLIRQMWLKRARELFKWLCLNGLNSRLKHKKWQLWGKYFPIVITGRISLDIITGIPTNEYAWILIFKIYNCVSPFFHPRHFLMYKPHLKWIDRAARGQCWIELLHPMEQIWLWTLQKSNSIVFAWCFSNPAALDVGHWLFKNQNQKASGWERPWKWFRKHFPHCSTCLCEWLGLYDQLRA